MRIYVTREDIDQGLPGTDVCPVARAARRLVPDRQVRAHRKHLCVCVMPPHSNEARPAYRELMPLHVQKFIEEFDRSFETPYKSLARFKPFHFDMPTYKESRADPLDDS